MRKIKSKIKISDLKLNGERVILRPIKFSDASDICSNIRDPKIAEQKLWIPYPFKLSDAKKLIQKAKRSLRAREEFVFGIELKAKEEVIGCVALREVDFEHEIAYWLGEKYRGQGIMTEALELLLDFAFKKLKLHRVWCDVFSDNLVSQKLLKKLGFKKEGQHREAYWHWGRWRDGVHYGLLDRDREFLRKKK